MVYGFSIHKLKINTISEYSFYNAIKTGNINGFYFKNLIDTIRNENDKDKRSSLKKYLPFFASPEFKNTKCLNKNVLYIEDFILDFDNIQNVVEAKNVLANDEYVKSVFFSSSGKGLKAICTLHDRVYNEEYYKFLWKIHIKRFEELYGLKADEAKKEFRCKSYFTYDKNIVVKKNKRFSFVKKPKKREMIKIDVSNSVLEGALNHLSNYVISYNDWIAIGFFLTNIKDGEELFVRMSINNENYHDNENKLRRRFKSFGNKRIDNPSACILGIARRYGYEGTSNRFV